MHDLLTGLRKKIFREIVRLLWLSTVTTLWTLTVNAQELLVHLPLDGSVHNAGGGAGKAEVVGTAPVTVQGRIGSAMKFDGRSVIAVPVDLSPDQYPQVTMTAWVRADETAPDTDHSIISTGSQGTTPALRLSKRRYGVKANMRGARAALLAGSYSPTEEWVFIAGTLDVPAQTLHVLQNDSTYDRDGVRTHSLYDASKHVNPNDPDADPQAWVFIGARTFDPAVAPAVGIAIDDVRVYGEVLTAAQLADIRDASGEQAVASAGVDLPGGSDDGLTMPDNQSPTAAILRERQGAGSSEQADVEPLDAPEDVGSDGASEQALTGAADTQRELPDQEQIAKQATAAAGREAEARGGEREEAVQSSRDSGMTLEEYNEQLAARNAEQVEDVDYESPTGALSRDRSTPEDGTTLDDVNEDLAARNADQVDGVDYESPTDALSADRSTPEDGMTLDELNEDLAEQNAERTGSIDHESPQDTLARDGTTQEHREDESEQPSSRTPEPDSGPMSPVGQMPVGAYLNGIEFGGPPTGNVRDCTSFAEVVRDVATEFRDKVVEFAATNACELLTLPVRRSRAAQVLENAEGYETNQFRQALLEETYGRCLSGSAMASRLPDAMIGFWNEHVANNSWATIGPRQLELGSTQFGTLVSPGDRKYITPSPVYAQNRAFLSLQERSGIARVGVRVCTVSIFNRYQRLVSFSVNETPEERQDESQYIGYDLNNIGMRFLIVHLDGAGLIGRRFQYELMVQ